MKNSLLKLLLLSTFLILTEDDVIATSNESEDLGINAVNQRSSSHYPSLSQLEINNAAQPKFLDPSNRPSSLQNVIEETYRDLAHCPQSSAQWMFNGTYEYKFLEIESQELIETLIKTSPNQKEFYILDIGAGNFSWGNAAVQYINNSKNFPEDLIVHVIGVTGENYGNPSVRTIGKCQRYNLDQFKIEDLQNSFKKLNLNLENKFDLIVSNFAFLHLHDPVGTFVQTYNLLRPSTGLVLMQGFHVFYKFNNEYDLEIAKISLIRLLSDTQAPFLIKDEDPRTPHTFLLKRPDDKPLHLPYEYDKQISIKFSHATEKFTAVYKNFSVSNNIKIRPPSDCKIIGDLKFFEWIWQNYPRWQTTTLVCQSSVSENKQKIEKFPLPLFDAVQKEDIEKTKELIAKGEDINQKDALGVPLIFFSEKPEIVELLISQANFDPNIIRDDTGKTVLHDYFLEPSIVSSILKHPSFKQATLNVKDNSGNTPLHYAVKGLLFCDSKKDDIILFLKAGADSSIKNNEGLTAFELPQAKEIKDLETYLQ